MKSLVRFGHRMLLAGAAIAGTTMGLNLPAWALPEEVILQKLETVPMYMLITDDGQPIFASVEGENGEEPIGVTGVFVSPSDAENLVLARREEAKTLLEAEQAKANQDPAAISILTEQYALWQEANILPIGLDRIYQFAQSDDAENLTFKFFPTVEQLEAASQVIENDSFPGVPLFFLSIQSTDESGNPITTFPTLEAGGQIPIFFEVDPILEQIQGFENQDNLSINVMALEVFISKLANDDLPEDEQNFLKEMTLIPAEESALLIQQIIESTSGESGSTSE
ncbi:Tic22 family protein [[Limnothrix rosea] IAM M-220]|uniref:Tic22 family protein n=1 Tax=[Limnothrix rosea] IAM M-220 TaxID=454133 RepID=UPI000960F0F4|nr:Tic22 family protein [[Limnothrix rosea] IAM M-220]OKH11610.1 hypothetical protein NIES208_17080 [[Limnothrix rosea] IAM M-220]